VIASRRNEGARTLARGIAALFATAFLLAGCAKPGAAPGRSVIDANVQFATVAPDAADYVSARLAAAALVAGDDEESRYEVERALASLDAIERVLDLTDEPRTGLVPAARDLRNAALYDHRGYRISAEELLADDGLDPALRERIERFNDDDPIALADARIRDAWVLSFGRAFNALAEPVGKSIMTIAAAPYRLAQSIVKYALSLYIAEPLPLQRRQALAHWKEYLARHPDGPEAGEVALRVQRAQAAWNRTKRDRMMKVANRALDHDNARVALVYADRALRYSPEDADAAELRQLAEGLLAGQRAARERSLGSPDVVEADVAPPEASALAHALFEPDGDVEAAAQALLADAPEGPLADEARFALATAQGEAGHEIEMWDQLEDLAQADPTKSNMARHAEALVEDPLQNPYEMHERAVEEDFWNQLKYVFLGTPNPGVTKRGLPQPVEWLIALPSLVKGLGAFPIRLIQLPWTPPFPSEIAAARSARRYLERHPEGEHSEDTREWLEDFEEDRKNWYGALQLVRNDPNASDEEIRDLSELAAEQALEMARKEENRSARASLLRSVTREFPDTSAGYQAGMLARAEVENATLHRIQISRGFLLENPNVAGPAGLAIQPRMLDGDPSNAELHPMGVALLGGHHIELNVVAASGDDDDAPEVLYETLSDEHLARLVARLEETSFRNSLLDHDDPIESDPNRDIFFERARLGLAGEMDMRPAAGSTYTYRGMRERYGMVRSRDSILPFDLVLQGSITDLSLGAFPRIRAPETTPDAILYK
jgi:hypothetical protein